MPVSQKKFVGKDDCIFQLQIETTLFKNVRLFSPRCAVLFSLPSQQASPQLSGIRNNWLKLSQSVNQQKLHGKNCGQYWGVPIIEESGYEEFSDLDLK